jgi:GT2 family glycosyltransferase
MIAICIPCWNQLWYTKTTVESMLRNSAGHDIMFFFVDNGSTDGTYEYLLSVKAKASIIRNPTNLGCNPAWNQLLKAALVEEPTMIVLANNDIKVMPGWLDPIVREFAKDESINETAHDKIQQRYFLPNGDLHNDETFDEDAKVGADHFRGQTLPGRGGWCIFFPTDAVRAFMPIPDTLKLWYGDDYIHEVLSRKGYRCESVMDSFVLHYLSKTVEVVPNKVEIVAADKAAFEAIMKEMGS